MPSPHEHNAITIKVAWDEEQLKLLPAVLQENRDAGDLEAALLTGDELQEVAGPALSPAARGAVLCPGESVVEPWLIPIGYAESAALHGADVRLGAEVVGATFDATAGVWTLATMPSEVTSSGRSAPGDLLYSGTQEARPSADSGGGMGGRGGGSGGAGAVSVPATEPSAGNDNGSVVKAKVVINCAGLYGDAVEGLRLNDRGHSGGGEGRAGDGAAEAAPWFKVLPRKGQFVVFAPPSPSSPLPPAMEGDAGATDAPSGSRNASSATPMAARTKNTNLPSHIIEPVATQFTKGVIVWVTMHGNVVVGPTATDQASKTDRSTDADTLAMLQKWGE